MLRKVFSRIFQSKHVYLQLNVYINNMQKYLKHIESEGSKLKLVNNLTYFW